METLIILAGFAAAYGILTAATKSANRPKNTVSDWIVRSF